MANPAQKVLRGGCRQEKAANPARNGLPTACRAEKCPNSGVEGAQRYLGQKKASFPAQNGIPPACRAGKHPKSCADGAPRRFRAEKGIISCAEWVTNRLPSRKMPQILRGRCVESARRVLRGGSGQKKGGFFEIVAAMCRSYHNFLYFCALYNLKTLKNYVTYCRLRFY